MAACAMTEYQVVNRASAPTRNARVDDQHAGAAHSSGERKRDAGEHQTRPVRADHDRKSAKRGKRAGDALPAQALTGR